MYIDDVINDLIRREGGFSNRPTDRGGPTNHGVTQTTLSEWRKKPVSIEDVKNLTEAEAYDIYLNKFFLQNKLDAIPDKRTQAHLLDAAAIHGPRNAIKFLQETIGYDDPDGYIGEKTLKTLVDYLDSGGSWKEINDNLVQQRLGLVRNLAEKYPLQKTNLKGWVDRIQMFKQQR